MKSSQADFHSNSLFGFRPPSSHDSYVSPRPSAGGQAGMAMRHMVAFGVFHPTAARPAMPEKPIAIASDHAGFDLKAILKEELLNMGFEVLDLGTEGTESVDYPDFADALAKAFRQGDAERGVLVCGSGLGISMAANRHPELRAAPCHDANWARLARPAQRRKRLGDRRAVDRGGCRQGVFESVFGNALRGWPARRPGSKTFRTMN